MSNEMNSKESLYGFCGWLTSRKEITTMGSSKVCSMIPDLIEEFSKVNNLPGVTDGWANNLVHPSGECSHINNKTCNNQQVE